jgi:nucleoid-associated protein YgaU
VRDPIRTESAPNAVFVPEVRTARIERGDSLKAISRRTYGEGDRYTAIYDANPDQIRDPELIYPG